MDLGLVECKYYYKEKMAECAYVCIYLVECKNG